MDDAQKRRIIQEIEKDWRAGEQGKLPEYDRKKYPLDVLDDVRKIFATPDKVTPEDINKALLWKYGKLGQRNVPRHQRGAISNVQKLWSKYVADGAPRGEKAFEWWTKRMPRTSYITYSFLVHLRTSEEVPIIDQHDFRAVQSLRKKVGLPFLDDNRPRKDPQVPKEKPSNWCDICLVRDFTSEIRSAWGQHSSQPVPTKDEFDRYLMMKGTTIKPKAAKKTGSRN